MKITEGYTWFDVAAEADDIEAELGKSKSMERHYWLIIRTLLLIARAIYKAA